MKGFVGILIGCVGLAMLDAEYIPTGLFFGVCLYAAFVSLIPEKQ